MNFHISSEDILHHNMSTVVQKMDPDITAAKRCLMQDTKKRKLTSTLSEIWFIPLDLKTLGLQRSHMLKWSETFTEHSSGNQLEGEKNGISKEGCKQRPTYCCSLDYIFCDNMCSTGAENETLRF